MPLLNGLKDRLLLRAGQLRGRGGPDGAGISRCWQTTAVLPAGEDGWCTPPTGMSITDQDPAAAGRRGHPAARAHPRPGVGRRSGRGSVCLNPGSVSLPKEGSRPQLYDSGKRRLLLERRRDGRNIPHPCTVRNRHLQLPYRCGMMKTETEKQGLLSRALRGARGRRPFVSHKKLGKTNKMTKNARAACAVCPVNDDP